MPIVCHCPACLMVIRPHQEHICFGHRVIPAYHIIIGTKTMATTKSDYPFVRFRCLCCNRVSNTHQDPDHTDSNENRRDKSKDKKRKRDTETTVVQYISETGH